METIKSIKKSWWYFIGLVLLYTALCFINYDCKWINSFLQVGAIILTIIFTLILTVENNKHIAEQTQQQIDFITKNTDRQIEELKQSTEKHIDAQLSVASGSACFNRRPAENQLSWRSVTKHIFKYHFRFYPQLKLGEPLTYYLSGVLQLTA